MQIENLHSFCYNIIKVIRVDNTKKFTNKADKYVLSRPSYSLTANDEKFDEYVKELNELFDKYEKNGIATVQNYTEVYIGEV